MKVPCCEFKKRKVISIVVLVITKKPRTQGLPRMMNWSTVLNTRVLQRDRERERKNVFR